MNKLHELFNFELQNGFYGIATEKEVKEMCKDLETKVYKQSIANYKDADTFICLGGEIQEGTYQVADGVIEVCGENEDYEIIFIKNRPVFYATLNDNLKVEFNKEGSENLLDYESLFAYSKWVGDVPQGFILVSDGVALVENNNIELYFSKNSNKATTQCHNHLNLSNAHHCVSLEKHPFYTFKKYDVV